MLRGGVHPWRRLASIRCRRLSSRVSSPIGDFWDINKFGRLEDQYDEAKAFLKGKKLPPDINSRTVFANSQLDLANIDVYGFDYDYTLASYKTSVEAFIHDSAKQILVEDMMYPKILMDMEYEPQLTIRGLHYDIRHGLLFKMDQFYNIQLGSVYRGRQKVPDEEVMKLYKRVRIPQNYVEAHLSGGRRNMVQLVDIFAKPMMCLLSAVIQWFVDNQINYMPQSIFTDVSEAIDRAHPLFHALVAQHPDRFLESQNELSRYLELLKSSGKTVFLITNSPFDLVSAGMTFMMGQGWRDIFDVIIVQAKKPSFFNQGGHFRKYLPDKRIFSWQQVRHIKAGHIYAGGSIKDLHVLTGWDNERVLYFGDHPYADLADLSLNHGWRTGAIIQEVEEEIDVMNSDEYKWGVNWATVLQHILEDNQHRRSDEDRTTLRRWEKEIEDTRNMLKALYNPFFGSIFRTQTNSSFFSRRLFRVADIYTSKITNMSRYNLDHCFFPRRGVLPHDFRSWFV